MGFVADLAADLLGVDESKEAMQEAVENAQEAQERTREKREKIRKRETKQRRNISRAALADQESVFDILGGSQDI